MIEQFLSWDFDDDMARSWEKNAKDKIKKLLVSNSDWSGVISDTGPITGGQSSAVRVHSILCGAFFPRVQETMATRRTCGRFLLNLWTLHSKRRTLNAELWTLSIATFVSFLFTGSPLEIVSKNICYSGYRMLWLKPVHNPVLKGCTRADYSGIY